MYRPRIIPTLLLQEGNLVKTKQFSNSRYLGDPINAIRIFNEKCVDELCVLDIEASKKHLEPNFTLLEDMASEAFMPLSYGGGLKNIDQIRRVFRCGFEKVVINTASMSSGLIKEASEYFGSQSIVCAIDYKKTLLGYRCYIYDGREKTKITPIERARDVVKAGAGELLLYSIDKDGMRSGYDIELIHELSSVVGVPVIACGGAASIKDIKIALDAGADAVAAGSLFVYFGEKQAVLINFPEEREFIQYGIYSEE